MEVWRQYKGKIKKVDIQEVDRFVEYTKEIEVDTETTGFDPYTNEILCVQLGCPEVQYLIPWCDEISARLKPLFLRTDKTFLFQNAKFDLKFFYSQGLYFNNNIYDTFLAESVIACGLDFVKKDLKSLADRYLKVDISKEIRSDISRLGLTEAVIEYGLNDVRYLTKIKDLQMKIIQRNDLTVALRLENSFVRALAYIEYNGIKLDKEKWRIKVDNDRKQLEILREQLNKMVVEYGDPKFIAYGDLFSGEDFACTISWSKPGMIAPLFEKLGLNLWVIDKGKKKISIESKVLKPQQSKHPIIPVYLQYAMYQKRVSTFGEGYFKFIHPVTGRIHTSYKQIMNTARLSCGRKGKKGEIGDPNLQQIPKGEEHRSCFISEDGHSMIASDYTGQEAVVFANKCMDPALLNFYDSGETDMHCLVASMCFKEETAGMTLKEIKAKRPDLRDKSKPVGLGIQFGGTGYTISDSLGISLEEGDAIYNAYLDGFAGIRDYFKEVSDFVLENGYVFFNDVTKRRSYIPFFKEFKKDEAEMKKMNWVTYRQEKKANSPYYQEVLQPKVRKYFMKRGDIIRTSYNYGTQGSAADITKTASCMIFNRIMDEGWIGIVKMVHLVHDEIIVECPDAMTTEVEQIVKNCMEEAGRIFYTRVVLSAVPATGKHWIH